MKVSKTVFDQLALGHLDLLYRVARRLTQDGPAAEDLVQDTYVRALRSREGFELHEFGMGPWLLRILHNLHASRAVREGRQPKSMEASALETSSPTSHPPIPTNYDGMDEHLVHALKHLPEEYRSVILLWALDELSYKEIAFVLEVPIGTVMSRLHRARERLARELRTHMVNERMIRE